MTEGFRDKAQQLRGIIESGSFPDDQVRLLQSHMEEVEYRLADVKNQIGSVAGFEGEHVWTMFGSVDRANDILLNATGMIHNLAAAVEEIKQAIAQAADYYGR